jgi:hypothetical protein
MTFSSLQAGEQREPRKKHLLMQVLFSMKRANAHEK